MVVAHDGGGGWRSDYESDFGTLDVDLDGLAGYGLATCLLAGEAPAATLLHLAEMAPVISAGVEQHPGLDPHVGDVGVFPEGLLAAQVLRRRLSDFTHFLSDVQRGLDSVGNAAGVIAEMYENTDGVNGAGLNEVGFAFGDPGAAAPAGFRPVESLAEHYRQQQGGGDDGLPMALVGDQSQARVETVTVGGWTSTRYVYPDNSMMVVTTTTQSGQPVTETVHYGPDRTVLLRTTETGYTDGSDEVHEVTVTRGDDTNGTTSTSSTTTHPDGSQTITNTVTTTVDGEETVETSTETVAPGERRAGTAEPGPIEEAVERFETYGNQDTVEEYGRGY